LEYRFWEARLGEKVQAMLENGAEDGFSATLERLYDSNATAYDELAWRIESAAESCRMQQEKGKDKTLFDIQLFAAPVSAWSRYEVPSGHIAKASLLEPLAVQLGAHIFSREAKIALADYLYSPDQLPVNFCDTWELTRNLGAAALIGKHLRIDAENLPETNHFLADTRYILGVAAVPAGGPIFRWNEPDGSREKALMAWVKQGGANLSPLFTGSTFLPLMVDAYHSACRNADREARGYAIKASVSFLQITLGLLPEEIRAVIAPCFGQQDLEEYRIGFAPRNVENAVYHGVVWSLLGDEDEQTDIVAQIEAVLNDCGVRDVVNLDHMMPLEYCDDCGAPLFPTTDSELLHAEMPEDAGDISPTLH
jgi:hypothetical protein